MLLTLLSRLLQVVDDTGISLAPSIVLAYLLHRGWSLHSAIVHVRRVYPRVYLNRSFYEQLLEEEETINGDTSVRSGDFPALFEQRSAIASS